jgi:hypothetical protein
MRSEFPSLFLFVALCVILTGARSAYSYDRNAAVHYAELYWNAPNHDCGSTYIACTPWSYWGQEACGYPSHGGDCANFVSQCVLAGGESDLDNEPKGICRGYPCGREEIGAEKLSQCLVTYHGWKEVGSGDMAPPPSSIESGDVLVYCDAAKQGSHAVLVVSAGAGKTTIACHSTAHYDMTYNYMTDSDHRWYRWLHNPAMVAVNTVKSSAHERCFLFHAPGVGTVLVAGIDLPSVNNLKITFNLVDLRGKLIRTFSVADCRDGILLWDGRDKAGARVSDKTCFLVAESSGAVIAVRKIVPVR